MKAFIHRLKGFLGGLSFVQKCITLFVCGVVLPMVVQNAVYYWQTEKNVQEEMLQTIDEAMDDKAEKINAALSGVLSQAKVYAGNETLYRYLDYEYDGDLEFLIRYQEAFQVLFGDSGLYAQQIRNACVYTDNKTMFNGSYVREMDEGDRGTLGEKLSYLNVEPIAQNSEIWLRVSHVDNRVRMVQDSRSMSIIAKLDYYRQYTKYEKLLRLDVETAWLETILRESNLFENMLLVDSQNQVVVAATGYSNSGELDSFDRESLEGKKDIVVLSRTIGDFPLTLYGIYDSGVIAQEFSQSRVLSGSISVLCLLFASACMLAIMGGINRRLRRLVEQSAQIAQGNFIQTKIEETGKDEFSILEKSINRMSAQLKELIDREYKAELARMELETESNRAKLLALQAQVNPHFMFNALESVRLKALAKGEKETAGVIKYMARMFRNLIEWDDNIITLKEEIGFLDEFLHIQNYRFEDEFSYEIDVSDEAKTCLIPKMMLQPLVENACVHGVEALSDDRWVRVEAKVVDEKLCLTVEDNGGGMTPQKLGELKEMLRGEATGRKRVGLWNVYRRLVLYYGTDFRFDIDSVLGKGTVCRIELPAKREEL